MVFEVEIKLVYSNFVNVCIIEIRLVRFILWCVDIDWIEMKGELKRILFEFRVDDCMV